MRSIKNLSDLPGGLPLVADDVLEFHAARIMLLIGVCGRNDRINGLTKLAKLDFFVRYPSFFYRACEAIGKEPRGGDGVSVEPVAVESHMVRYHYGPWDRRYYQVLAYLEAKGLVSIEKIDKSFDFALTPQGSWVESKLRSESSFNEIVEHMKDVKRVLGKRNGASLKSLVYQVFDEEVAQRSMGEVIESGY